MKKNRILCVVGLWAALLVCSVALAQNAGTGAIAGSVADPGGAFVPNATIKVTNPENGETRTVASTSTGNYTVALLPPGTYVVEVSSAGFKDSRYDNVVVHVTETRGLNVSLKVGSVSETVDVNEASQQLQTETASLGHVTSGEDLQGLPLVTRNFTQVIALLPGVNTEVNNAGDLGRGNGAVAGSRGFSALGSSVMDNTFQMNGANVNDFGQNGSFSGGDPIPNPDTIQEFKVQTVAYDASYGRAGGANVNVVTKGGTNTYHGSLFEFFRNTALNANDYFFIQNGVPRAVLQQNQFGLTFGGPLLKDRLTFFTSYQGTRQANGISSNCQTSYVGPPLTNSNRTAAALGALFANSPTHFQSQNGLMPGDPGAGVSVASDGSNISAQALTLLNFKLPSGQYLIPNAQLIDSSATDPTMAGSTVASDPCFFNEDQFMTNADWTQSSKSRWGIRFFFVNSEASLTFNGTAIGDAAVQGFPTSNPNHFRNTTISNDYVFTPKLLNHAVIGYNRLYSFVGQPTQFTWPGVGVNIPSMDFGQLPVFGIEGLFDIGGNGQGGVTGQNQYILQNDLAYIKGRHTIRVGGGAERNDYVFSKTENYLSLFFLSVPDFLLGLPGGPEGSGGNGTPSSNLFQSSDFPGDLNRNWRTWDMNLYVQDDVRVTNRLVVNLGLRFERLGALGELAGRNANFDFQEADPTPPATGTLQGYVVPGNYPGTPPAGVRVNKGSNLAIAGVNQNGFAPRIGFSWQLPHTNRVVLRGGWGLYHQKPSGQPLIQTLSTFPWSAGRTFETPDISFPNPIPGGNIRFPSFDGAAYAPGTQQGSVGYANNFRPPSIQHYSLNIQIQTPGNALVELGYVGGRNTNLITIFFPDQAGLASPAHPIRGVTTNTVDPDNIQARLPVQGISPTNFAELENSGSSWYNAAVASFSKRVSRQLSLLASYTWTRDLTTEASAVRGTNGGARLGDQTIVGPNWGPDSFIRPHRLVVSGVWQLPRMQGWNRVLRNTVGGWNAAGVFTIQSGQRLTVSDFNENNVFGMNGGAGVGGGGDFAQYSGTCSLDGINTPGPVTSKLQNYINASCFTHDYPIIGSDGIGTTWGNSRPGIVHGPAQNNIDASLAKVIPIKWPNEIAKVEFRAEAFNLLNHPQFSNPTTNFASGSFGKIRTTAVAPRLIQFALKVHF